MLPRNSRSLIEPVSLYHRHASDGFLSAQSEREQAHGVMVRVVDALEFEVRNDVLHGTTGLLRLHVVVSRACQV